MLHVIATRDVVALDSAELRRYVPALLTALRSIEFDHGVYVDHDGTRREGLRLVTGVAGEAGAIYRLAQYAPSTPKLSRADIAELRREIDLAEAAGIDRQAAVADFTRRHRERIVPNDTARPLKYYDIEVERTDTHVLAVHVTDPDVGVTCELAVDDPGGPSRVRVDAKGVLSGNWLKRGPLVATGHLAIDRLPPADSHHPQLLGNFRLRRWRGDAHVRVVDHDDRWTLEIRVRVGGRGLLRPLVALAGILAGARIRQRLSERITQLPDPLSDLHSQLDRARNGGTVGATEEAERFVAQQLRTLPEQAGRS